MDIDFPKLSVTLISDRLLPKRPHQALVQLILHQCPVLHRTIKYQAMPPHFWGSFGDPIEVMLQCSWSATPAAFYVYDKLIE